MEPHGQAPARPPFLASALTEPTFGKEALGAGGRSTLRRRTEFCSVIIHKYSVFYFEKPSFYVKNT